jgi:hypothetical protein
MKHVPMLFEFWLKAHEAIDAWSLPVPNNHNVCWMCSLCSFIIMQTLRLNFEVCNASMNNLFEKHHDSTISQHCAIETKTKNLLCK